MTAIYTETGPSSFRIDYDPPESAPNYGERGSAIEPVSYDDENTVLLAVIDSRRAAEKALPPGSVYEIRGKRKPSDGLDDFRRRRRNRAEEVARWGVAWYFLPRFADEPLFDDTRRYRELEDAEFSGCLIMGRFRTPVPNELTDNATLTNYTTWATTSLEARDERDDARPEALSGVTAPHAATPNPPTGEPAAGEATS